jgi:hypothetical protein
MDRESLIPKVFYVILNPAKLISGERPLYIKTLLPVVLLLVVSCSGEQPAGRATVDATQRWLNAKCPPSEVCAPKIGPEIIGRAYLAAVLAGDCDEAAIYWDPDLQTEAVANCQQGIVLSAEISGRCRLTEYNIEKLFIEDTAGGKSTNYSGYFLYVCTGASREYQTNSLKLFFNARHGEWRITGIDG